MNGTPSPRPAQGLSLHQTILADIETRILSGEWPPGHRIPFEHELTARYGCSRMTVNKAMTQLAGAGLIERRRKAGSFVRLPQSRSAALEINDLKTEVQALGLPYRFDILARRKRKATAADAARIDLAPGAALVEVVCLHRAAGNPFCLEQRLINLASVPEAGDETFSNVAPGTWLVARVPWSTAEHRIRAVAAGRKAGALLQVPAATPCLAVERRTFMEERQVTHVLLTYPGASHELVARFAPPRG